MKSESLEICGLSSSCLIVVFEVRTQHLRGGAVSL
jgi:hypothetical protein